MYKKIQELCKKKNISIYAVEIALGFPRGSIYKWDSHTPGIDKVKKLAEYLDVAIEELLA